MTHMHTWGTNQNYPEWCLIKVRCQLASLTICDGRWHKWLGDCKECLFLFIHSQMNNILPSSNNDCPIQCDKGTFIICRNCTEILMLLHCGVSWNLNPFQLEMRCGAVVTCGRKWYICDMVKGNESDVRSIDFELQAKIGGKCLCIVLSLNFKELVISLQLKVRLWWGLDQNAALQIDKWLIEYCWYVTHFPWSCHISAPQCNCSAVWMNQNYMFSTLLKLNGA